MIAGWFRHRQGCGAGAEEAARSPHGFSNVKRIASASKFHAPILADDESTFRLMPDSDLITQSSGASHGRARRATHKNCTLDAGNEKRGVKAGQ